jgi:hypothetical protein
MNRTRVVMTITHRRNLPAKTTTTNEDVVGEEAKAKEAEAANDLSPSDLEQTPRSARPAKASTI